MTEKTEKTITGKLEKLFGPDTTPYGGSLAVVVNGQRYTQFTDTYEKAQNEVKRLEPLTGHDVILTVVQRGRYWNMKGRIEPNNPTPTKPPTHIHIKLDKQEKMKDKAEEITVYQTANKITDINNIVDEGAIILGKCYEAVQGILGRAPQTDGDKAMVNSLFIYSSRKTR